jgi:hypothetical protein
MIARTVPTCGICMGVHGVGVGVELCGLGMFALGYDDLLFKQAFVLLVTKVFYSDAINAEQFWTRLERAALSVGCA